MSSSKAVRQLQVASPVPADIDIAHSVEPLHISEIAKELNLSPDHYDLYGKYKAKVIIDSSSASMQLEIFFWSFIIKFLFFFSLVENKNIDLNDLGFFVLFLLEFSFLFNLEGNDRASGWKIGRVFCFM
jgi:hypothetical protein